LSSFCSRFHEPTPHEGGTAADADQPRARVQIERALKVKPNARPAELAHDLALGLDRVRGLIHLARRIAKPKARSIGADPGAAGTP